jgi:subtilisin family serine protease
MSILARAARRIAVFACIRGTWKAKLRVPTRVAFVLMVLCAVATPANGADVTALDQQLLVMIPTPPAHFRPDSGYAGDYQNAPGHAARRRIARQLAREHDALLLDDWPMPALNVDCYVLQAASRTARDGLLKALEGDPRIAWAQPMQRFQVLGAADPLYSLQPAAVRWHLRELHGVANGRSVAVAQIDTGVDLSHPDLRGQIAQARNFVDAGPFVAEPHGTQVAGIIIAREDNGIGIAGIAPRARLLALRACWQQRDGDVCSSFTLAQALQFALQSKVQVVNLSLGGPTDRLLQALLDVALERGTTVVAAVDARAADGGFPASHPGVLAVAASETGVPAGHSIGVPGRGIPTTTSAGGWDMVSGSSYAAAQVTGLVALLRELSPRLSGAALRDALVSPAPLGSSPRRPPTIDACAAVARVSQSCACDCDAQALSTMPRR